MAAPEFTLFVAPYVEGYQDGEEGNTPITAEILNENYDAFLLALNEWAASVGLILDEAVTDPNYVHTDNNYTTTEKNKLSGIADNANNYSLPTASDSVLGGVKVDDITITISNGVISAVGGGTDVEGNPSGTPTAVLSSIRIGSTVYSIPGGGGGGSSVSFTQVLSTGTKIGTITIDGVPTDIYAPTPPAKTSDLTNDSNFVADANYVHTDNNYTSTEKNKLSGLVAVEANPSGSASTDLTKIAIGGTNYNIPSGGGGTTVVANPSGSATAGDLEKLQVGNDIYSVPSGGSGSGGHTILNDSNTALAQEDDLQFKGTYVHDDSTNEKTVVEITRVMTSQQYNSLSSEEKKGVVLITDEEPATNEITYEVLTTDAGGSSAAIRAIQYDNGVEIDRVNLPYNDSKVYNASFQWHDLIISYGVLQSSKWGLVSAYDDIGLMGTKYSYGDEISRWSYSDTVDLSLSKLPVVPELPYKDITGTLSAGETSITLSDASITTNSTIDIYTDLDVPYNSKTLSTGSITITFDAQQSNMSVKVRVS